MTGVHSQIIRGVFRIFNDDRGVVAILFAAALVPVAFAVGAAVDFGRALAVKSQLQTIVDAAALAGASVDVREKGSTEAAANRMKRAESIFDLNKTQITIANDVYRQAIPSEQSMLVTATASVPTTLTSIITPKLDITAQARATYATGTAAPLCMLSLNKSADETMKVWGTADLLAPGCAVQSHSSSQVGMVSGGSATAQATHFCSVGGSSGSGFDPKVENDCTPVEDPYAALYNDAALAAAGINVKVGCSYNSMLRLRNDTMFDAGSQNSVVAFCGGITVKAGATATFGPGVYKIFNEFRIESGATVIATDATFYFANSNQVVGTKDGFLTVIGGGNLELSAPSTGPLAGIAILQPTVSNYTGGSTPALTHTIIGGGSVNIYGTIYTPQAKVRMTGNGTINDKSDYFSIAADFIELEGNGQLYIQAGADAVAYGYPGMTIAGGLGGDPASLLE